MLVSSFSSHNEFVYFLPGISILAEHCLLLQIIFLRRCVAVDDFAVDKLASCCLNLTQINLGGCSNITDAACESIAKYSSKLSSLNISRTKVGIFLLYRDVNFGQRSCSNLKILLLTYLLNAEKSSEDV